MNDDIRLSLRALRAFVTVVEHGSITAAARALNIAPSAIAAALDQVETEMGASLLIRTRARGITATSQGRELAARFRDVFEQYQAALDTGRDMAGRLSGTLRIGYYAPVAPAFLPRVLHPMMQTNPDLRLDLRAQDNDSVQEALLAGQVDVILFAGQDLRSGIETDHLLDLPPYLLARKGHELLTKTSVALSQLADVPLIQLDRPLARPYLDRMFRDAGLKPNIVAQTDSTEMVRSLVGAGVGVAILNMRPLTAFSYGGDALATAPLAPGLPKLQLVSGRASGRPRKLVSAFLKALHSSMAADTAQTLLVR